MNAKEKAIKSLEGFRLNKIFKVDVDYDFYKDDDVEKAIDIAIKETNKEVLDDLGKVTCSACDLMIKRLKQRHLSPRPHTTYHFDNQGKKRCSSCNAKFKL